MVGTARRTPRQRRSNATVGAILEAGSQVLARDGLERFTTAAVAARAGVSVGSLYQYFANKDDLLVALTRRALAELHGSIADAFGRAEPGARGRAVVRAIMRVFAEHGDDPGLDLVLRFGGRPAFAADTAAFAARFGSAVGEAGGLSREVVFVMTRAVLGVVGSLAYADGDLDRSRVEAEMERMVNGFFTRSIDPEHREAPWAGRAVDAGGASTR